MNAQLSGIGVESAREEHTLAVIAYAQLGVVVVVDLPGCCFVSCRDGPVPFFETAVGSDGERCCDRVFGPADNCRGWPVVCRHSVILAYIRGGGSPSA